MTEFTYQVRKPEKQTTFKRHRMFKVAKYTTWTLGALPILITINRFLNPEHYVKHCVPDLIKKCDFDVYYVFYDFNFLHTRTRNFLPSFEYLCTLYNVDQITKKQFKITERSFNPFSHGKITNIDEVK